MKTVHLLTLMRNVLKTAGDFWSRYQCDEMFDIKYVTVDSEYARKNILTEMLQRSLCLAHILGLKVSKTLRISFTQCIKFRWLIIWFKNFFTLKGSKSRSIKYIQPVRLQEAWVWDAGMLSVRRLLWERLRRK